MFLGDKIGKNDLKGNVATSVEYFDDSSFWGQ